MFVEPITDFEIYDDVYYEGLGVDPLVNYADEYARYASTPRRFEFQDCVKFAESHFRRPDFAVLVESPVTWLDFGCGAGGLLKYLRDLKTLNCQGTRRPIHLVGHDVGSYSERLKYSDGFEMLDQSELYQMPPARFDVITCIEVIEHTPNPRSIIQLLARNLKPGGLLILTTGNMSSPLAKLRGINFTYCIPEIHISLLTPSLLTRLYHEAGLTPIRLQHYGTVKFRFLKNLQRIPAGQILALLANFPPAVRFADLLFGVSAMPSAFKPLLRKSVG